MSTADHNTNNDHDREFSTHIGNNVLKMVFSHLWTPLHQFIARIMADHHRQFTMDQCPNESTKQLLAEAIICVPPDSGKQPSEMRRLSFDHGLSQSEIVNQVIHTMIPRQPKMRPQHVLAYGYSLPRPGTNHMNAFPGVECFFPNTVVNLVKGYAWIGLLTMIGDELMTYILKYAIVLVPVPNGAYLQVSGYVAFEVYTCLHLYMGSYEH